MSNGRRSCLSSTGMFSRRLHTRFTSRFGSIPSWYSANSVGCSLMNETTLYSFCRGGWLQHFPCCVMTNLSPRIRFPSLSVRINEERRSPKRRFWRYPASSSTSRMSILCTKSSCVSSLSFIVFSFIVSCGVCRIVIGGNVLAVPVRVLLSWSALRELILAA